MGPTGKVEDGGGGVGVEAEEVRDRPGEREGASKRWRKGWWKEGPPDRDGAVEREEGDRGWGLRLWGRRRREKEMGEERQRLRVRSYMVNDLDGL